MPDTVTDQDVKQARKRVDKLHEAIAEERAKLAASAVNNENAVRVAALMTEEQRLEAELNALRQANATQGEAVAAAVTSTVAGGLQGQPAAIVPPPPPPPSADAEPDEDKEG